METQDLLIHRFSLSNICLAMLICSSFTSSFFGVVAVGGYWALGSGSIAIELHPKLSGSHLVSITATIHPFTYHMIYTSLILYDCVVLLSFSQIGTLTS